MRLVTSVRIMSHRFHRSSQISVCSNPCCFPSIKEQASHRLYTLLYIGTYIYRSLFSYKSIVPCHSLGIAISSPWGELGKGLRKGLFLFFHYLLSILYHHTFIVAVHTLSGEVIHRSIGSIRCCRDLADTGSSIDDIAKNSA